jgi:hypothetical protein
MHLVAGPEQCGGFDALAGDGPEDHLAASTKDLLHNQFALQVGVVATFAHIDLDAAAEVIARGLFELHSGVPVSQKEIDELGTAALAVATADREDVVHEITRSAELPELPFCLVKPSVEAIPRTCFGFEPSRLSPCQVGIEPL